MGSIFDKQNIIDSIGNYDLSFVKQKHDSEHPDQSDISDKLLVELKRWMSLCLIYPNRPYVMYGPVDTMWHTFLLFTYEYRKFCYTYGDFVHHHPTLPSDSDELDLSGYEDFLSDYKKVFGDVDTSAWPALDERHPICKLGGGRSCSVRCRTCRRVPK